MNNEDSQLTYLNSDGDTVYTSGYLRNRGTCCKSYCLHCPYDFTLKKYQIELVEITKNNMQIANEILKETTDVNRSAVASSLLASAFGTKESTRVRTITSESSSNYALGVFKNVTCGVIEFSNTGSKKLSESANEIHSSNMHGREVKNLYLKKEFQDQGLGIEHIKT